MKVAYAKVSRTMAPCGTAPMRFSLCLSLFLSILAIFLVTLPMCCLMQQRHLAGIASCSLNQDEKHLT